MNLAEHRRRRNAWFIAAPLTFAAGFLIRLVAPAIAPFVIAPVSWIWCLVFATYHKGWVRGHADAQMAVAETCGHCGRAWPGYGGRAADRTPLCHGDYSPIDCYTLVTRDHHPMPCERIRCVGGRS